MPYSDLHTHPFLRPYQQLAEETTPMSVSPNDKTSVWHLDAPLTILTHIEQELGFISFTQGDFTNTCQVEGGSLVIASLYAVESGFFKLPKKNIIAIILKIAGLKNIAEDLIGQWITRYQIGRVDFVKSDDYDYFEDLKHQFDFALKPPAFTPDVTGANLPIYNDSKDKSYIVIKPGEDATPVDGKVKVVLTVEGGNCLWSNIPFRKQWWNGRDFSNKKIKNQVADYKPLDVANYRDAITPAIIDDAANQMNVLIPWTVCNAVVENVQHLKNLATRPMFITLAHHFYNGISGHERSLQPLKKLVDQDLGCGADISNLGWMVINEMLKDKSKRILLDVKHMSIKARMSYYAFRRNYYPDVPVIYSHAAAYGGRLSTPGDENSAVIDSTDTFAQYFYKEKINLLDDDIKEIATTDGIFGLELDQRVNGIVGNHKDNIMPEMLWHNIRYIAETISKLELKQGRTAWDYLSLGTDFDGVINPHLDYSVACDIPSFRDYIKGFLTPYLAGNNPLAARDKALNAEAILDKIFYKNVADFVNRNYV